VSLVATVGVFAALATQGTTAGFTAKVTGSGTYSSGSAILADTIGGTTCTSSPTTVTTNATNCTTNPLPNGTLPAGTTTAAQTTTLSAPGTLMSSVAATGGTCGVQFANDASSVGTNDAIVHQTVTFGSSGPLSGSALAFTQSSSAYLSTLTSYADPETFSLVTWFKFATGDSGTIVSFSNNSVDSGQSMSDRALWLSGGKLYWGVSPAGVQKEVSASVTAGTWHQAVAVIGSNGQRLYIDGALAASATTVTAASAYTGYWHLGWGAVSTWANPPANAYWPGSLGDIAVIPSQVTAAQVTTLWSQTTNAAEQTQILARTPTSFWPLDDTGAATYTGTVPGAGIPPFADASGNANTGVPNGTFVTNASGPLSGAAQTFDGSTSWMGSTTQYNNPHPLTITAWFKTSIGGTIIEYTNIQTGLTGNTTWDRHIWVDGTGHLVWGVWNGADDQITSPGTYADGTWHQVAASVGPAGMLMYVDGTLVASNTAVTVPENSTGYWRLGDGNENNVWADPPPNVLWQGSLAQVAVYPAQLTAAQISALTTPTTATAYQTAVLALSPSSYWELNQGPATSPCAAVNLTIGTKTGAVVACALPSGSGACPAPSSVATLASWASVPLTGLTAGGSQTVTVTLARGTVPVSLSGVHISGTMTFSATGAGFTAGLSHNYGPVTL
jgi:Concanavalin A-like lectin/glucanases superfamily